jgi:hypothetical protein
VGLEKNAVVPKRNEYITEETLKGSLIITQPHTTPTVPTITGPTPSTADVNQREPDENPSKKSESNGQVVLQFGWSDTDTSKIDSALGDAGIANFKRSDSSDKGLGIAVVTIEQAEAFKTYADDSEKVFANILKANGGLSSTDNLRVSFSEDSSSGEIGFGGRDYGGIVTDDPSRVVSGSAKGEQKGDDALWSTENGNSAKAKMLDGPGGREFVKMDADIEI